MEQKLNVLCICIFVLVKDSIGLKVLINSNKKQAFHCGGDNKRSEKYVLTFGPKKKGKTLIFKAHFRWLGYLFVKISMFLWYLDCEIYYGRNYVISIFWLFPEMFWISKVFLPRLHGIMKSLGASPMIKRTSCPWAGIDFWRQTNNTRWNIWIHSTLLLAH